MAKVAIIGAGSIVFCKTLMLDILSTDGLEGTEFALMAPRYPAASPGDLPDASATAPDIRCRPCPT